PALSHTVSRIPQASTTPSATSALNATTPMNVLGNPKAADWADETTSPQLTKADRSQPSSSDSPSTSAWSSLILSFVRTSEAHRAIAPPIAMNRPILRSDDGASVGAAGDCDSTAVMVES